MSIYVLAFFIGVVAGLRAMTAPAAVSWGARLGWLNLEGTWLAILGFAFTPFLITLLAIGELINDKLPNTPSRKATSAFAARIVMGAVCGAAIGASADAMIAGLVLGILGAVVGTIGGFEARSRLVKAIGGKDLPIAILEDLVAVGAAFSIIYCFR